MNLQNYSFTYGILARQNAGRFMLGLTTAILILAAFFLRRAGYFSPETILAFLEKHGILAPIFFILIYSILPSLFLPTLPLNIGSGFLWGPFWGVVFSIVGSTLGASLPFLIARYLAGDSVTKRVDSYTWKWLLSQVDKNGWKVVAFTRINPVFPSTLLSYLFGLTSISFVEYLWSTFVFMLPPCIAFVAFGSAIRDFVLVGNIQGIEVGIIIAILALLSLFGLKPIIKKILPEKG